MARLHHAWRAGDTACAAAWSALLHASRPSAELQTEDRHLGSNLARLLDTLAVPGAAAWAERPGATYAAMFALAASHWGVSAADAASGYAFAWLEAQVGAAVRLVPLGQSAGQRILLAASALIPRAVRRALALGDDDIGAAAPSQAIASAHHETQYCRLFRS